MSIYEINITKRSKVNLRVEIKEGSQEKKRGAGEQRSITFNQLKP
jgi:hypothetical protein